MQKTINLIFLMLGLLPLAGPSLAVDYDYETARARWEAAQKEADSAQSFLQSERNRLAPVQRELDNAVGQEQAYTNQLINIRNNLRNVENQIATKESSRRNYVNQKEQVAIRIANLTSEIGQLDDAIVGKAAEIRELDRQINVLTRRINQLEGQDPNHPELPGLRSELDGVNREQSRLVDQKQQMQNQRDTRIYNRQEQYDRRTRLDADIATLDRELDQLGWDRRNLNASEQDTSLALNRARDAVAEARSRRDRVQLDVDRANASYQAANSRAADAERYYQEVLANYNRAMNAAVALGTGNGQRDSGREADERSLAVGTADGQESARIRGGEAGTADARLISDAQGYNYGRASGSTDAALSQSYSRGITDGKTIARNKAQAENFPAGYNSEMNERLARSPSGAVTVDISDEISDEPGDAGAALLDPKAKAIGSVREPGFNLKTEPPFAPPPAVANTPTVPNVDRRYYRVDCGAQPLPVFDQACRTAYDRGYNNDFPNIYRNAYARTFRNVYTQNVNGYYTAARQVRQQDVYNTAANQGAVHKGTLDGFAAELRNAQSEAEQNGRRAFTSYLTTGFLPILRTVSIDESFPDDNLSPGEIFKLKVVIDNYGLKSSKLEKLRLNIKQVTGGSFLVAVRKLPSLAADTTTTLEGVLKGAAGRQITSLALNAVLELEQSDGTYLAIDEANFNKGIRLPLELSSMTFPQALGIGVAGSSVLTFKNNTSRTIEATTVNMSANAEVVGLANPQFDLPDVEPGTTVNVTVGLTATARAGGNQLLDFKLTAAEVAGTRDLEFTKSTVLPISRNANLDLCLPSCTTPYQVPLRVRAGATLILPAQFTFLSTQRQQGPFEMGKLQVSDNRITGSNGSTLRASLGSWSPGSSPYRANFGYDFPLALKGQEHWVSLYIKEGNRNIHVVQVPVIVE
jgi:hypothetical protein